MSEVDGATLVARSLKRQGVKFMFGIVGFPVGPIAAAAQQEGITYAAEKGVFVVSAGRAGSGRIPARQRPADGGTSNPRFEHLIQVEDLSPVKARILLMLALTRTQSGADIQRIFLEY